VTPNRTRESKYRRSAEPFRLENRPRQQLGGGDWFAMKYSDFHAALEDHNAVGAGLSSSIFTLNLQEAERFLAADGYPQRQGLMATSPTICSKRRMWPSCRDRRSAYHLFLHILCDVGRGTKEGDGQDCQGLRRSLMSSASPLVIDRPGAAKLFVWVALEAYV
jgi:hypothetical protein